MIASSLDEAFEASWLQTHLLNQEHDLVLLRQVIPWQHLVEQLGSFYPSHQGRWGKSLRTMIALLILSRLRPLSDEQVVARFLSHPSRYVAITQQVFQTQNQWILLYGAHSTALELQESLTLAGP